MTKEHDPSNYEGYQKRHTVLHGMGCYKEAFRAFEMMLLKMKGLADPQFAVSLSPHRTDVTVGPA
jgi:hypothetical protein